MGLEKFQTGKNTHRYKAYGSHEYNEKLEKWAEEFEEEFPTELDIQFIEVSPRMTKYRAKAYRKGGTFYIRVAEYFVTKHSDRRIKLTLLHEMVHVYFYKKGYPNTNHDKYFRWVAGRVGASMTNMDIGDDKWQRCIEPFLEEDS